MKVTLINTSDAGGGAPVACMRLLKALEPQQIDVNMLVQDKKTSELQVKTIATNFTAKLKIRYNFLKERLPFIWLHAKERSLRFAFSTADAGMDISKQNAIQNADLLHLHWTNFGYLSINNIKQLLEFNKPVVWTLHDMWAFTGGCHYSGDCDHFTGHCGNCWMLRDGGENDLSAQGWLRKEDMLSIAKNIVFVTCSHWLAEVAKTSSLLKDFRIETIPNPIDIKIFSHQDKDAARLKWDIDPRSKIILFGAANILDRRKGIAFLVEALNLLKTDFPEMEDVAVLIFGKNKSFDVTKLPSKVYEVGMIGNPADLAELYSLADVYVSPSIEDNLPNTIMEALACSTPVVAFNTGGIPDLVDHQQNGYLAEYRSAKDLAAGIHYVINSGEHANLSKAAREKVLNNFTNEIVAKKYIEVYQSIISK